MNKKSLLKKMSIVVASAAMMVTALPLTASAYTRCEMTPTSVGGEQQISISGGSQSPI